MKKMVLAFAAVFAAMVGVMVFSPRAEASGKILVAYFSYQGHTAGVAREMIPRHTF